MPPLLGTTGYATPSYWAPHNEMLKEFPRPPVNHAAFVVNHVVRCPPPPLFIYYQHYEVHFQHRSQKPQTKRAHKAVTHKDYELVQFDSRVGHWAKESLFFSNPLGG